MGAKREEVVNTFLAMFPCNLFPNPLPQACRENAFDKLLCSQSQKGGIGPGLVYGEPQVILALSQTSRKTLRGQIFSPTITAVIYKMILTIAKGLIKNSGKYTKHPECLSHSMYSVNKIYQYNTNFIITVGSFWLGPCEEERINKGGIYEFVF